MTSCPQTHRTALPAAVAGARSWRLHFVQPSTKLLEFSGVETGLAEAGDFLATLGAETFSIWGTTNEVPQGHFEL